MSFKIGDRVAVVEDTRDGIVVQVLGSGKIVVEIDGFDWEFSENELVGIRKNNDYDVSDSQFIEKVNSEKNAQSELSLKRKFRNLDKYGEQGSLVIDLHIQELIDSYKGMTNSQIIQVQLTHFRSKLNESINKRVKKLIVIHGKGKGVLKAEIIKELNEFYPEFKYQDASFYEFGYNGATEIFLQ